MEKRVKESLEQIIALIEQDYREGDKEYQAVIIARRVLKPAHIDITPEVEEKMFEYRREGWDD
jgi:hypothetical protein